MKIDLKRWGTREDWEFLLRRVVRFFGRLSKLILVSRIRTTELVITLMLLAVALYLGIILLYLPPAGAVVAEPKLLELNTKVLDRLVSWQREREQAKSKGLEIPAGTLFP